MAQKQFRKPYSIYKPLPKADAGGAVQWSWSADSECIFVEMCRQKGPKLQTGDPKQFDWKNDKITFKLGYVDIGKLLLVGSKPADLVHQTERDGVSRITTMKLKKQTGDYDNYQLQMSKTEKKGGETVGEPKRVNIYIDHHEMQVIAILLRRATEAMLGF